MNEAKLMVLDPGHFHAALVQSEMYPWLSPRVSVYAPLGPDVMDYLNRVSLFNMRPAEPTAWQLDIHTGPDFFERMLREKPGNVVVLSGRNRAKMERITASVNAGLHVLADKPWIITSGDMQKLESVLNEAEKKDLAAYDIMTERFEITSILQRELVNDPDVFGTLETGSATEPAVFAKSIHHLMKVVAGVPLKRPAWFFDIDEYGEGLADVGTHVVDLVQWTAFPEQMLDYRKDVRMLEGKHWPTMITKTDFARVTGEGNFPPELAAHVEGGKLAYFCNNSVHYTLRGAHVKLEILWNWEAPERAGDVYEAAFRGTRARVEIRQGRAEQFLPELYVVGGSADAVKKKVAALQGRYPGLAVESGTSGLRIVIPKALRVSHEAHFAQVTNQFAKYLREPRSMPAWEKANMLVKYFISTKGVEMSR